VIKNEIPQTPSSRCSRVGCHLTQSTQPACLIQPTQPARLHTTQQNPTRSSPYNATNLTMLLPLPYNATSTLVLALQLEPTQTQPPPILFVAISSQLTMQPVRSSSCYNCNRNTNPTAADIICCNHLTANDAASTLTATPLQRILHQIENPTTERSAIHQLSINSSSTNPRILDHKRHPVRTYPSLSNPKAKSKATNPPRLLIKRQRQRQCRRRHQNQRRNHRHHHHHHPFTSKVGDPSLTHHTITNATQTIHQRHCYHTSIHQPSKSKQPPSSTPYPIITIVITVQLLRVMIYHHPQLTSKGGGNMGSSSVALDASPPSTYLLILISQIQPFPCSLGHIHPALSARV